MATIASLPPEILIEVMKLCNPLDDIHALINASPIFLQLFIVRREQLLKSTVDRLRHDFSKSNEPRFLRNSILALRLRSRHRDNVTIKEAETANNYIPQNLSLGFELSTSTQLSLLCGFSRLLTEALWIMKYCASEAWYAMYFFSEYGVTVGYDDDSIPSDNERWLIMQAAMHYEAYCRMFFLNGKALFKRSEAKRERFFATSFQDGIFKSSVHCIARSVFNIYMGIWFDVSYHLSTWGPSACSKDKGVSLHWESYVKRFNEHTELEKDIFIHFLTSQGLGMIYELHSMDFVDQIRFILQKFYETDLNAVDWCPKRSWDRALWQPWDGIETEDFHRRIWRDSRHFWDEGRFV